MAEAQTALAMVPQVSTVAALAAAAMAVVAMGTKTKRHGVRQMPND
jgi:hypothetical protein